MKALVLLAHGTEEMEAVIVCDILSRAGITVVKAAVESSGNLILNCANGMKLVADINLDFVMSKLDEFSFIILPGGSKGAETFCSVIRKYFIFKVINCFCRTKMFKLPLKPLLKIPISTWQQFVPLL